MIKYLMLLLIQLSSTHITINRHYTPQNLPRDQWYEVMNFTIDDQRYCVSQFLASHYRESFWGIIPVASQLSCEDFLETKTSYQMGSEFFRVEKNQEGLIFTLEEGARIYEKLRLWGFREDKSLNFNIPSSVSLEETSKILEQGDYCVRYNQKCEKIINEDCSRCKNGWMNTVGDGCKDHYTKVCASECGGAGERACPQGLIANPEEAMGLVCPLQVIGAICNEGLTAYCYEHNVFCK